MKREKVSKEIGDRRSIKLILTILISTVILCAGGIAAFILCRGDEKKELPTFNISLKDITLEDFQKGGKKTKYPGNEIEVVNDGESIDYQDVEVRGRGNSTWGLPKPPFQIKFNDTIDFFGLGGAKKWVLLANYVDSSNLRNDIAFKLADMLGEKYATRGEFVKVNVDGEYLGIYYLTHKMETKKGSVNLKDNYGVLMEIDNLHRDTEDCIDTSYGNCMTIKDTVADEDEETEIRDEAVAAFMKQYNQYEEAVRAKDYEALTELIDIESFAEYFLVSEFSVNPDAYSSSVYFYKDGLDDKIHAGPIWDYDYAFSNRKWVWRADDSVFSPYNTTAFRSAADQNTTMEYYYMLDMPEFTNEVKRVYQEKLSGKSKELLSWLKGRAELIKEETLADAERWDFDDTMEDTEYLIDWVRRRYDYLEWTYGK